jgi:hypothetical protein
VSGSQDVLRHVATCARCKMCCRTLQRAVNDRQVARRVRSDRRGRAEDQARLPRRRCARGSWRRRERARCSTGMAGQRARPAVGRRLRSGGCCKRILGRSRTLVSTHEPAAIAASSAIMRLCASVCVRAPGAGACACQWQRACAFARDKGARVSVGGQRNAALDRSGRPFSVAHAAPKLVMLHLVLEVEESITQKLPEIVRSYNLQARAAHLVGFPACGPPTRFRLGPVIAAHSARLRRCNHGLFPYSWYAATSRRS